jgi:site-specific recombinase XerD
MNLEVVSVESLVSFASPHEKPEAAGGHCVHAKSIPCSNEPPSLDAAHKQAIIEDAQYKMAQQGLFGAEHVHDYLMELCRRNCRPNTLRSRFGTILVFPQYLKAKGRHLFELVCREDVCAFIEHEQDRGLKPASVSNRIDGLYAFIRFLVDREVLGADLLKRKLRVKVPDSLPRAIDPQDVRRLLAVTLRPRDRAMVLVLLRTGMRIGELLHTTLADVNLAERRIEIVETQKNRVGSVVYLAEDACRALAEWLNVRRWQTALIFPSQHGAPLSYEVALTPLNRYGGFKSLRARWKTHCQSTLRRPVLLIDEAQETSAACLTELRLLQSACFDSESLLFSILCGDTRLPERFRTPELLPLGSRIRTRLHLNALSPEQLQDYLALALTQAGHPQLITEELIRTLCTHALNNLRVLNHMAAELLSAAAQRNLPQLDESLYFELFVQSASKTRRAKSAPHPLPG